MITGMVLGFASCQKNSRSEDAMKKQDERELQSMFRTSGFSHPVFIDTNNEINSINKFPSRTDYQCFLLDRDNKVLMIGNPSVNAGIWTLYKRIIAERETRESTEEKREESFNDSQQTTLSPDFLFTNLKRKETAKVTI